MIIQDIEFTLKDGRNAVIRSPREEDIPAILDYLVVTAGETDFLTRYPEARGWGERIDVNVVRSNLLVDCGALYFRATTPQIEGGNVSLLSGGQEAAHFCTPEVLRPLGIREIPFGEIGILKNQWLNDE